MANFNKVMLIGNLTRDPQLTFLPSEMAVCNFGLAVNRKFRTSGGEDREEVLFIECTAFGKQAQAINQYCGRGKPLFVDGRLRLEEWQDKNGGGKRSKISVVVENFQFLGAPPARDNADEPPGSTEVPRSEPKTRGATSAPVASNAPQAGFEMEDVPFAWEGCRYQDI